MLTCLTYVFNIYYGGNVMEEYIHPLKLWLIKNRLSQRKFSKKIGVHEVNLSRIINGGNPDLVTLSKIYEGTDFELDMNAVVRFKKGA